MHRNGDEDLCELSWGYVLDVYSNSVIRVMDTKGELQKNKINK